MAQNFYKTAAKRVNPVFKAQTKAVQAQLPAITRLYEALNQSLMGQNQAQQMQNLEGASARGVLRSTIPVDVQTGLEQALIGQQAQLGAEQAKEVSGVNQQLAGIGVERMNAINTLAQALFNRDIASRGFRLDKRNSALQRRLQRQLANQQYSLDSRRINQGI